MEEGEWRGLRITTGEFRFKRRNGWTRWPLGSSIRRNPLRRSSSGSDPTFVAEGCCGTPISADVWTGTIARRHGDPAILREV